MRTPLKIVLMSSLLVFGANQVVNAEQTPTNNFTQNNGWTNNQAPILWGDCVPVPVMPIEFPQMPNNMQAPFPVPMQGMQSSNNGMPMMASNRQAPFLLPPPSPFFNTTQDLIPMPVAPAFQAVPVQQPACNNNSVMELHALQSRYTQAAAASKNRIIELQSALDDAQHQMHDGRNIVKNFTAQKTAAVNRINALEAQLKDLDNAKISLQAELTKSTSQTADQNRKLTTLDNTTKEFDALKGVYKERNDESVVLKKKISEFETKLNALQTASTLKSAQDNDIITALKTKLANFDNSNKTLKSQISTAEASAGAQARKLTALGQSAGQLDSLKSAYKERSNENVALKEMIASLKTNLETSQTQATLKGTQDNGIIDALKKKVADFDNTNKTLQSQLMTAKDGAGSQARKLTALTQTSAQLVSLKSAYKACSDSSVTLKQDVVSTTSKIDSLRTACTLKGAQDNDIIESLEKKLAKSENDAKSLLAKISMLELNISGQARKITALTLTATEFTALKSAYTDLNAKKASLATELAALKADDDKDSVLNIVDQCLTSPSGSKVNSLGCPADSDNDGVLDSTDKCPTSPRGSRVNSLGCPADTDNDGVVDTADQCPASPVGSEVNTLGCPADTDKDGVLNFTDQCPTSPAGSEVNALGCPADKDFDGVTDNKDACPSSPVGSKVNATGCPVIIDTDGDNVADINDLCPSTVTGATVNEFGCTATENITLEGVNFATGSARLTTDSLPILTAAASTITKAAGLVIEVAGYTDNQGGINSNQRLSQRRANTVMLKLIENGVQADKLTAKGYGVESPVATNATAEGRATNRRVELKIR